MRYLGSGRARTREEVEQLHESRLAVAARAPGLGFWAGFVGPVFVGWWILEPPERPDQGRHGGRPNWATDSYAGTGARGWPARERANLSATGSRTWA